jgi:hypothetical protein
LLETPKKLLLETATAIRKKLLEEIARSIKYTQATKKLLQEIAGRNCLNAFILRAISSSNFLPQFFLPQEKLLESINAALKNLFIHVRFFNDYVV